MKRLLATLVVGGLVSSCAGGSAARAHTASPASVGWTLSLVPTYDYGMSHVGVVLVLADAGRPVSALVLGRFLDACSPAAYAELVPGPAPEGTLFTLGCRAMPELAPASRSVVARVVRRGAELVAEWAELDAGATPVFVEAGALPVATSATVVLARAEDGPAQALLDAIDVVPTVRSCNAYPPSCEPSAP